MAKSTISNGQSSSSVRAALNTMFNDLYDGVQIVVPRVLFVMTSGNDTTGNGSLAKPYLTPQKAFEVAEAGTGFYVIFLGVNEDPWPGITCPSGWPSRIFLNGISPYLSRLASVTSTGQNIEISGCNVAIGSVTTTGATGEPGAPGSPGVGGDGGPGGDGGTGGTGGNINLTGIRVYTSLNASGGAGGPGGDGGPGDEGGSNGPPGNPGSSGAGGNITISECYARTISVSTNGAGTVIARGSILDIGHPFTSAVGCLEY